MNDFAQKVSDWLLARLAENSLSDPIPPSSLKMICDRVSAYYLAGNIFDTSVLVDWLTADYGIDRGEATALMRRLQKRQSEIGVNIYILEEWEPSEEPDDEGPGDEEAPAPQTREEINTVYIQTSGRRKGKKKEREDSGDDDHSLSKISPRMVVSEAGGEKIFRAYAVEGKIPLDQDLQKLLKSFFVLDDGERRYYRGLSPSQQEGEVAGWAFRVNGNALAYEYAALLARREDAWAGGRLGPAVKQLDQDSAIFKAKVRGLLLRLQRERAPEVAVIEAGLARFSRGLAKIHALRA